MLYDLDDETGNYMMIIECSEMTFLYAWLW